MPSLRAGDRPKARLHPEARFLVVTPPAGEARPIPRARVPLVDEAAAHRAGAGVQVLVGAPHGEVHVPVVEAQDQVPRRVRQVEADDAALRVRELRDRLDVEGLARVVLDSRRAGPGRSNPLRVRGAGRSPRCRSWSFPRPGPQPHERRRRVEAVEDGLGLDRVVVRGERVRFEEDPVPVAGGPIEARHHQVQVDGERVHGHDFGRPTRPPAAPSAPRGTRGTASTGSPRRSAP